MSLFRWSSEHDIYLPEVDAEHRALFLAGEELHRALQAGARAEKLKQGLHHLLELTEAHFLNEERLMRESGFASLEWHCRQHDTVRKKAKSLSAGDRKALMSGLEFLAGWLHDHTSVADRIMAAHVRNWSRRMAA